jgi:hypothetical protein
MYDGFPHSLEFPPSPLDDPQSLDGGGPAGFVTGTVAIPAMAA